MYARDRNLARLGEVNKYDNLAKKYALDGLTRKQKAIAKAWSDYKRGENKNPFSEPYTRKAYDETIKELHKR